MTRTTQWLYGWLLLLPATVLLAAFTHYPAGATLWHSFLSTPRGARPAAWVGADNYAQLGTDPIFWQALSNNLWYAAGTIPVSIALALLMAVWVNGRIAGRGFLRLAYFTPTVLPMIAVANIWLFFYTPEYGLLEKLLAPFGVATHNWLGSKSTALPCLMVVTVWKEAGFFMIFYLAALQSMSPRLAEAAAIEGASRWYFFRRVTFPLLMPHDAVRARQRGDQCIPDGRPRRRDDARRAGQRDLAPALLHLRDRVPLLGHGLRRRADDGAARDPRARRAGAILVPRAQGALPMSGIALRGAPHTLESTGAWLLGLLWILPLVYAFWTAFHPSEFSTRFLLTAPLTLDNFARAWAAAPFARYFLNTLMLVTMVLAAQLVLVTLAGYAFARFDFPGRSVCSRWCWSS